MIRVALPFRSSPSLPPLVSGAARREYDLPFNDDRANRFVIQLIALMTFLAFLSVAAGLVLSQMSNRWSEGLSSQVTLEIPAVAGDGTALSTAEIQQRVTRLSARLDDAEDIRGYNVQMPDAVSHLLAPWLGESGKILDQVPLPALMTLDLQNPEGGLSPSLQAGLKALVPELRIESHEGWLRDLLRLTSTLSFAAWIIGLITAITTVSAVAGAVQARMTAHREQLEILHLIGASDEYITRQFQKHALQMSFIGTSVGAMAAALSLVIIDSLAGQAEISLVPTLALSTWSLLWLALIPVLGCVITIFATRMTVLQALKEMP